MLFYKKHDEVLGEIGDIAVNEKCIRSLEVCQKYNDHDTKLLKEHPSFINLTKPAWVIKTTLTDGTVLYSKVYKNEEECYREFHKQCYQIDTANIPQISSTSDDKTAEVMEENTNLKIEKDKLYSQLSKVISERDDLYKQIYKKPYSRVKEEPQFEGIQNENIAVLKMDNYINNALRRKGIHLIGQLLRLTDEQILNIPTISLTRYSKILKTIEDNGLAEIRKDVLYKG